MTAAIGTDGLAFLRTVLPAQGIYFAVEIRKSKDGKEDIYVHTAFLDIQSLHAFFMCADATSEGTLYFAVAAFRELRVWNPNKLNKRTGTKGAWSRRTHSNVRAIKVLIADIDTRESKTEAPYADRVEAYKALVAFCEAVNLPRPLVVSSGGGLHCYWVLDVELTLEEWEPYARGLKAAAAQFKFSIDPARTADASSVLRPVGTTHRKSGLKVTAGDFKGAIPLSAIEHLKRYDPGPGHRSVRPNGRRRVQGVKVGGGELPPIAKALQGDLYEPSDPAKVVKACRQLGEFARNPSDYSEPFHYAAAGLFGHCEDGREFYLDLLDDDWRATGEAKLDQYLSGGWGPTTCQRFEGLNPGGCDKCPFKGGEITSPIVLGRRCVPIVLPHKPLVTLS
jgi:hypothetical protein